MKAPHPYRGLPDRQFWKHDPGIADPDAFDPVGPPPFTIAPTDRVVTAGSCFAQHVARRLSASCFTHHITEKAPDFIDTDLARDFGYGLFAARYGNLYTPRQLGQLIARAYGRFEPLARCWPLDGCAPDGEPGPVVDPFRPQIQPGGFLSEAELLADRQRHFAALRAAFETMQVFVFTLGLTECWEDPRDGAVFPLAPGIAGGRFDRATARFRNLGVDETIADLRAALAALRAINPAIKIVLTVSPVALNATMEDVHVAVATSWSKAVLRVAADTLAAELHHCVYFPSFEIITAPQQRGRHFAADCRDVRPEGVDQVMRLFFRHFAGVKAGDLPAAPPAPPAPGGSATMAHLAAMERDMAVLCDEAAIANRYIASGDNGIA